LYVITYYNIKREKEYKKKPLSQYLLWEGKYYDIDYIYIYQHYKRQQLTRFAPINPTIQIFKDPFIKKRTFTARDKKNDKSVNLDISHVALRNHTIWKSSGEFDYVELNLGEPLYVTHIGTAGQYPNVESFPNCLHQQRLFNQKKSNSRILIVKGDSAGLAWVTTFELSYRSVNTRKWIVVGNFIGNSDAMTEQLNDLLFHYNSKGGLFTQYLRIRPLEYHIHPMIRIAVYGRSVGDVETIPSNHIENSASEGVVAKSRFPENNDKNTICYTISKPANRYNIARVRDGKQEANYYRYDDIKPSKFQKNKVFESEIAEEKYGDDEDDYYEYYSDCDEDLDQNYESKDQIFNDQYYSTNGFNFNYLDTEAFPPLPIAKAVATPLSESWDVISKADDDISIISLSCESFDMT
jgi:hypothetical protein